MDSDLLRYAAGALIVAGVFSFLLIEVEVTSLTGYLLVAYGTGLLVALGGAYKDAPFEGFKWLKFQRSGLVLALLSPLFYLLGDPLDPLHVGFLIYMNDGLERFAIAWGNGQQFFGQLSLVFHTDPLLAAILPPSLCLVLGIWLLQRVR